MHGLLSRFYLFHLSLQEHGAVFLFLKVLSEPMMRSRFREATILTMLYSNTFLFVCFYEVFL